MEVQKLGVKVAMAACAAAFAGCASAPPQKPLAAYFRSHEAAPQYPRQRFLSAAGESSVSGEEAEGRARAGVAQQISASIQVEQEQWARASGAQGSSNEASHYLEKIQLRSDFSHAELVRIAERAQDGGTFYALAVIDRAEGEAALARDVAADEQRFAAAADRALAARLEQRAGEFNVAAAEAQGALPAVESSYVVRHALLRTASAAEQAHLARRNALISALAAARSRRVVDVRIEGAGNPTLLQRAVAAVQRLGLRVAEGKGCGLASGEGQDATELVLMPEVVCGDGSFGPRCDVSVRMHARGCAGGGEGEGRIAKATGAHVADRDRALLKAWEKVTDALVDIAVRDALKGSISAGGM